MATGTHQMFQNLSLGEQIFLSAALGGSGREELGEGEGVPNPGPQQLPAGAIPRIRQRNTFALEPVDVAEQLLWKENLILKNENMKLREVVQNSKFETAEMFVKFGQLASDWADTVKQLNAFIKNQKNDYEARIGKLEETNAQLLEENDQMKKLIEDLTKMKSEFEKQKRKFKLGQIAFQLDILVSEYVFPGNDKASRRARYGSKLKSLQGKIEKMSDVTMRGNAEERMGNLQAEMFEEWFLGMVDDVKVSRFDTAHPDLGTYEEMQQIIHDEFKEDDDKRDDLLVVLNHLNQMYKLLNREFGK